MSLLMFHSWELDKLESADQYQAHGYLGLLENKPQINADERRLIHKSNCEFANQYQAHSCLGLLKNKPQMNADERRFIESDDENFFLNRNSITSPHIFNKTYLSNNYCLLL